MKTVRSAALLAAAPVLALAQEAAGNTPAPSESTLWWMWIALALVLLGALVAIFARREPRPQRR
jgi:hypothetical protein